MSTNPYQPPDIQAAPSATRNENQYSARRSLRIALLILLVPAIYNFVCFSVQFTGNQISFPSHILYLTINTVALLLTVAAIWFIGLTALEFITGGLHSIVARKSKLEDWKESLYEILRRAPYLAVPGAVLWAVWVIAIYQLQFGFYVVSVPIGIAAHALAACLYLPLIYRWFRVESTAETRMTT